jgi:hypothetical protein
MAAAINAIELHPDAKLLEALTDKDVAEIRAFHRPPALIAGVLGNVQILLGLSNESSDVRHVLYKPLRFLESLRYYDQKTQFTTEVAREMLDRYHEAPDTFNSQKVQSVHWVAAVLCDWVVQVCRRGVVDGEESSFSRICSKPDAPPPTQIRASSCFTDDGDNTDAYSAVHSPAKRLDLPGQGEYLLPESMVARPQSGTRMERKQKTFSKGDCSPNASLANPRYRPKSTPRPKSTRSTKRGNFYKPTVKSETPPSPGSALRSPTQKNADEEGYPWYGNFREGSSSAVAKLWLTGPLVDDAADAEQLAEFDDNSWSVEHHTCSSMQEVKKWIPEEERRPFRPLSVSQIKGRPVHPDAGVLDLLGSAAQVSASGLALLSRLSSHEESDQAAQNAIGVLENVHCLLLIDDSWEDIKTSLKDLGALFLHLRYFRQSSINIDNLQHLRRRLEERPAIFCPEEVGSVSRVAAVLSAWVNAVCRRAGPLFSGALQIASMSEGSQRMKAYYT